MFNKITLRREITQEKDHKSFDRSRAPQSGHNSQLTDTEM